MVCILAILVALAAGGVFQLSHFRIMDIKHGVDAHGNSIGWNADYTATPLVFLAVCGAVVTLVGAWFDVPARLRAALIVVGAATLTLIGVIVASIVTPWNDAIRTHYHVGEWGSPSSFNRLFLTLDGLALLLAACGVAVVVLWILQRRRIAATYPD